MITDRGNLYRGWGAVLIMLGLVVLCLGAYASVQYLRIKAQLQYVDLTTATLRPADKRILLTSTNSTELLAGVDSCDKLGTLNEDPPDRTVKYRNTDLGLEFDVPFNPKWGSEKYKVNPYDDDKVHPNVVHFGQLLCDMEPTYARVHREHWFSAEPHRAEQDIMKSGGSNIEKKKMGNLIVFVLTKCIEEIRCDETIIVLGKKYDYYLTETSIYTEKIYKRFLPILESLKFIE